jgi:hypothetical protein
MNDLIFPQNGDPNAAELFALLLGQSNTTDFVGDGLDVSVDTAANEASVTTGNCYVHVPTGQVTGTGEDLEDLGYALQVSASTVALPFAGTNHLAVVPDIAQTDTVSVEAYEFADQVPEDGLYIASANADDGTVVLKNRNPDIAAEQLSVFASATVDQDMTVSGNLVVGGDIERESGETLIGSTIDADLLSDNSITIQTNSELSGGGEVTLGGTITLDVDVPVQSVFGRTGAVTAQTGDYSHGQISGVSSADHHQYPVPNSGLTNDSITVNATGDLTGGGTASLGGDITIGATIPPEYTDTDAISAVNSEVSMAAASVSGLDAAVDSNDTDISSLQTDKLDVSNYNPEADTHSRYTDSESIAAVDGEVTAAAASVSGLDSAVNSNDSDIADLQSDKLDLSGGTLTGTLTLSDGSTAASQLWVNNNADVPNADYADEAGDASTVGGLQPGEVKHYATESDIAVEAGQFAIADDTGTLYFEDGN